MKGESWRNLLRADEPPSHPVQENESLLYAVENGFMVRFDTMQSIGSQLYYRYLWLLLDGERKSQSLKHHHRVLSSPAAPFCAEEVNTW